MIYTPAGSQGDLPGSISQVQLGRTMTQTGYVKNSIPKSIDFRGKQAQQSPIPFAGGLMAVVNTAITACSGTSPGNGSVDIYYLDGTGLNTALQDPNQKNVNTINWYTNSGTINTNTHVAVIQCGNFLLLLGADC